MTEADESATSKEVALANLLDQVLKNETMGVIDMYERAAWNAGANVGETESVIRHRRLPRVTDYEAFVQHVRALRSSQPELSFTEAARLARSADPALASRVLDAVGSWPSSEPEIRALQGLS